MIIEGDIGCEAYWAVDIRIQVLILIPWEKVVYTEFVVLIHNNYFLYNPIKINLKNLTEFK